MSTIEENLERVRERMRAALGACGREASDVELVAVSKKKPAEAIRAALDAGQDLMGENRIQEVLAKQPELPGSVRWHLIGHLQSNKVKQAVQCEFELIHSVDSAKLMRRIDTMAGDFGVAQAILLQVNVSGEGAKYGIAPDGLIPLLEEADGCRNLDIQGLMTIPPLTRDPADAAPQFASLRELRDRAAEATGYALPHLSMGMSRDMDYAIREGATLVRVGTDIFGARE